MRHTLAAVADLIFVTQLVDANDDVLGFTLRQVRALARRTRVVVIANEVRAVPADLGAPVFSLGKEAGRGRLRRTLAYQRALVRARRGLTAPVLFAHMCPEYVVAARPLARLLGVPLTLWFTHPRDSRRLGRAVRASERVFTAMPGSFPRADAGAVAIGHSIDMAEFAARPLPPRPGPLQLVAVGRTSPIKGYAEMIEAVGLARRQGGEVVLRIVGGATTAAETAHRAELRTQIDRLGLGAAVTLAGPVPPAQVAHELAAAHVLLSATAVGSADKAVFEALACGRPVVTSNTVFSELLSGLDVLAYPPNDAAALAQRLIRLAATPRPELSAIGTELRRRVEHAHSLEGWAEKIVTAAEQLTTQ